MGLEHIICVIGAVVVIYFMARPRPDKKPKDKLTKEVAIKGFPPTFPFDGGGPVV